MRLGTILDLRIALGGKDEQGRPLVGETYAVALKRAAGLKGTRLFDVDAVIQFRKRNPRFKVTDIYRRQPTAAVQSPRSSARKR